MAPTYAKTALRHRQLSGIQQPPSTYFHLRPLLRPFILSTGAGKSRVGGSDVDDREKHGRRTQNDLGSVGACDHLDLQAQPSLVPTSGGAPNGGVSLIYVSPGAIPRELNPWLNWTGLICYARAR